MDLILKEFRMSLKLTKTKLSLSIGVALCTLYMPLAHSATFIMEKNGENFAIDGSNGEKEGQQLKLWETDTSASNQQWVQINQGDGYYSYKKFGTDVCWDGGNGGSKKQAVTLESCDSADMNQHWKKISIAGASSTYRFEKRNTSGYSIDSQDDAENGQLMHLWSSSDSNVNQQWVLTNVNDIGSTSATTTTSTKSSKGIDSSTGYADNYYLTKKEMTLDFDKVSWSTIEVSSANELKEALSVASPGDKIVIKAGTYKGNFKLTEGGSKSKPIWIVGESASNMPILDGKDYKNNTTLAIDGNDAGGIGYVYIQNVKVTNARTGIAIDQADYVTIDDVEVYKVGQSGIHLRDGSEYSIVKNSYIHDTGLYNVKYGEGVYIGSDYTKWPGGSGSSEYDPAVDYAQILNNKIGPNVTAEHIDVKEGSSHAYIIGNIFDAKGMNDIVNGGLSFIDFKGNYTECAYNIGDQNSNEYFENAFEINKKQSGWGKNNNIHHNTVTFDETYYNKSNKSVTINSLPLGENGKTKKVNTTEDIQREQWVVKNNVDSTNKVSSNIRTPEDKDRMYDGDVTEY